MVSGSITVVFCVLVWTGSPMGFPAVELSGPADATAHDDFDQDEEPTEHEIVGLASGRIYLSYAAGGRHVRVSRSVDGGFTWPGAVENFEDLPEMVIGHCSAPVQLEDALGVLWSGQSTGLSPPALYFARLDTLGRRVGDSSIISSGLSNRDTSALLRLRGHGDRLVGVWLRFVAEEHPPDVSHALEFTISQDSGATWSTPGELVRVTEDASLSTPSLAVSEDGTFYACVTQRSVAGESGTVYIFRLDPGGQAWMRPSAEQPAVPEVNGEASLVVHPDGTVGLAISVLNDDPSLPPLSVWFITSGDRGESWSEPTVFDALGPGYNDLEPHLAVDGLGRWHLAWRVCEAGTGTTSLDVYYARSTGSAMNAWTDPTRVNTVQGMVGPYSPRTLGIAVDDDGHAYISYSYSPERSIESIHVMTTRHRPYDGYEDLPFFDVTAVPNPFHSHTTFRIPVPDPATAELHIFDLSGRLVRAWPDLRLTRGPNPIVWDGRNVRGTPVAAGVYYWRADVADQTTEVVHEVRGRIVRTAR